ncbi:histidine kinase [Halostagnicola sp. A56]|uniref:histidine kinase n=1 Tax=Halostagnicola sp. A56 TaxID=1495067 RepID=UPI00049F29F3|nr:histidine kinase [Halostagnicola sp. A56]KDE58802.1 histidine kinase [Halostagnicola sp. A56]
MSLKDVIEAADRPDLTLAVINREASQPLQSMLEELFADQPVSIEEHDRVDEAADTVYLLEDDTVIATSPLHELSESILLGNSDLFITGTRSPLEVDLPDVIVALENTRFRVRGYPDSSKEKFLLITISRYIEGISLERGDGTHRASFQRLSRIEDERGTRSVYRRLSETSVATHVYGVPDRVPQFDVTVHGGQSREICDSWFVVSVPDETGTHAALVALETGPRTWEGFWTFDPATVTELDAYIRRAL